MDRFVKNFIGMSIIYLAVASVIGLLMLGHPSLLYLKFAHSHLMVLGWVSMMIFGVGYHILPRFSGRPLKSPRMGEVQFWLGNTGLIGMVIFQTGWILNPGNSLHKGLAAASGILEVLSISLFLYNMLATIFAKAEA